MDVFQGHPGGAAAAGAGEGDAAGRLQPPARVAGEFGDRVGSQGGQLALPRGDVGTATVGADGDVVGEFQRAVGGLEAAARRARRSA